MTRTEKARERQSYARDLVSFTLNGETLFHDRPDPKKTIPQDVRCLSVKDPWITLTGTGRKPFELRKRRTHYRGIVVLCSSSTPSRTKDAKAARDWYGLDKPADPPGHALYIAELVDCRPALPTDQNGACCKPVPGEFVWEFRSVHRIKSPVPIKGKLGLFKMPRDIMTALQKQGYLKAPVVVDMTKPRPITDAGIRAGWR